MSIKITEEGKTLLEDAILQDKKVVFSQIELISDVEKSPTEMVKRVDVSKVSASDYNTITVQAQIDNDGFLDTYYFNRANVYADEVLFAYDDGINICIPAETTKVINDLEMMMKIDSAVADLKIIYEGYVLRKDFDDMESKIQKINTTIKDMEANAVTQNDCTDQVSWNSQIVKKEFLTIGNMAFFRATGGFSTSRGSIVLATIPQGYFPETTRNQSSYELMGVFTSAYDKERRNCYVTLNCLSGNVDLQINNNEAYSDTRSDDNVQMIFYGFWKMNAESQGGTGGSISYREDIEKLRQSIQDSKKEIVKSGREIDSLKENLDDLSKEVGHTSTNLLKITGYEITTPNIGVSFSLGDDGRIVMSGKATNGNFVVRLNCEEAQLNSGEDYTANLSSQFTNVSVRLMRKAPISGTSAELAISGGTSKTWTAINSVISYITLTLQSGYSTDYDGYIWFSKGTQATNYEPVGFVSEIAKKAELETFEKSVNTNVSGFQDELFERCGLIEKKGVFEPFSPITFSDGIDVLDAPFEYNRFNNVSKKIIVKPSTPANHYNIQQAFTFGNFESITVLMYTTVRAFNNKSKLQFYIQLASSKASNKYGTAMFVDASLLNVGWGAYKIPLSAFTFANGASIDEMDLIRFRLRVLSSSTEDLEIICGGYIYNERMKPTVVMSFDGVYDTDTVIGGKFDALIQNKIHATMFQSVNTIYSDDTKSVFYNHVINDGLEIQMYATANREYVQTEDNPETQYNELRTQKEWLYENRIGGLPAMYAAPNGILPNTTINLLKSLDFKMARSGSAYFVNRFTEKDFNVGFKGIFGTNTSDSIKNMIDEAIAEGKAIFLFTHEVKNNPASYDSDISNFKSVCDYIGEQITNGKIQSMNFTEFYNACVN